MGEVKQKKHDKVHLLIISETGRVKSRKISIRFVKWFLGIFLVLFVLTLTLSYLYLNSLRTHHATRRMSPDLIKETGQLRHKVEEQAMEIKRLQAVVLRLTKENRDIKQHLISRKPAPKPETPTPALPPTNEALKAYRNFIAKIDSLKVRSQGLFKIRDPKIVVSAKETAVSFKLYKETMKKMAGKFILLGIYKPENPDEARKVVAFPKRGVAKFKIRPAYGRYFRIERQFLPVEITLPHPEGVSRFSEFHIFVYGLNRGLLFHEKFTAP